jgi:hypothetical protein
VTHGRHSDKVRAICGRLKVFGWKDSPEEGFLCKTSRVKQKGAQFWAKRKMRIKLQENSCRVDIQMPTKSDGTGLQWIRIAGGYWRDCEVLPDGRVKIGGMLLGQQSESESQK